MPEEEYKRQMDSALIQELRAQRDEHDQYFKRFDRIIDLLSDLLAENKMHIKRYERHEDILFGNGKPGLVMEVDRLMQDNKKSKWFWGLSIAAIVQAAWQLLVRAIGK